MRACDDDDGRPRVPGEQVPEMAPIKAARVSVWATLDHFGMHDAASDRVRHLDADESPDRLSTAAMRPPFWGDTLGGDDRRNRIGPSRGAPLVKSKIKRHSHDHRQKENGFSIFQHDPFR